MSNINTSVKLKNNFVLSNRLVKAAMSENLANKNFLPDTELLRLYERFSSSGAGLLITGNILIDKSALGEPNNVVLDELTPIEKFQEWASIAKKSGSTIFGQINHPGRQSPVLLSKQPVAPSPIAVNAPFGIFATPRALREEEIIDIIRKFTNTAIQLKKAGFDGVEIHAAHGYLISQFLSPLTNQRTDQWGGTLENRMRFLFEIYRNMRSALGKEFPIAVKLNSKDFQKGGFSEEESSEVAKTLCEEGIDLLEISGGTYEKAAMTGIHEKETTRLREAYFLEFAHLLRKQINCPLMVTGGFRTREGMDQAISEGIDLIGLARTVAMDPNFPNKILSGESMGMMLKRISTGIEVADQAGALEIGWYQKQLLRMGEGKNPDPNLSNWDAVSSLIMKSGKRFFFF
ncbi:MAG: NADH:flavin oxidoreductase/NADH oxidase family protein [Leptospiraceae bacterium]|nr:NADH:flavin oxidoreductase/NADH oxidase family protein [Leptospiraceae bacterium]